MPIPQQKTQGACLFDLDGTLAATDEDLCAALNIMLRRRDKPPVRAADMQIAVSRGGRAMIAQGFSLPPAREGESAEMDALFAEFIAVYEENICVHSRLYPGVQPTLEGLRAAGIPLGVITNKPAATARMLLEKLAVMEYFPLLIGGDSLAERKPHPLPFLHALEALGCEAGASVMVGDNRPDTEGAAAAGLASVAVSFGYRDVALEELGADMIIHAFDDLPRALREFGFSLD